MDSYKIEYFLENRKTKKGELLKDKDGYRQVLLKFKMDGIELFNFLSDSKKLSEQLNSFNISKNTKSKYLVRVMSYLNFYGYNTNEYNNEVKKIKEEYISEEKVCKIDKDMYNKMKNSIDSLTLNEQLIMIYLLYYIKRSDLCYVKNKKIEDGSYYEDGTLIFKNMVKNCGKCITHKLPDEHKLIFDKAVEVSDDGYILKMNCNNELRNKHFTTMVLRLTKKLYGVSFGINDFRKAFVNYQDYSGDLKEDIKKVIKAANNLNHSIETCIDYYFENNIKKN